MQRTISPTRKEKAMNAKTTVEIPAVTIMSYPDYEAYRKETCTRPPKSEAKHRERTEEIIETLYSQKNYRALELIWMLADELMSDAADRVTDVWYMVRYLLRANLVSFEICKAFISGLATPQPKKPKAKK